MTDPATLSRETNVRFWKTGYKPGMKLDMSIPDDKAQSKVWLEINRQVKAEDAAHALVLTPAQPRADEATLTKETNARFWSTYHHRTNQKLDMSNPRDKEMSKKWLEINRIVKGEDAAGMLHLTYNDPVVVQKLAEAQAAEQAAVDHHNIATTATDPDVVKQAIVDRNALVEHAVEKGREAAAAQPISVPPRKIAESVPRPPPRNAPAEDHVAHGKQVHAVSKAVEHMLIRETNVRYWTRHHRRPPQDPNNPADVRRMRTWMNIFREVQGQYARGRLVTTYDHPVVAEKIANADVADKAEAMHADAADAATDPADKQQNLDASATAGDVKAQELKAAADAQKAAGAGGSTATDAPSEGWSTTTKVLVGGGVLAGFAALVKILHSRRGSRSPSRSSSGTRSPRSEDTAIVRAFPPPTRAQMAVR